MQLLMILALFLLLGGRSAPGSQPQISGPEMIELLKYASGGDAQMDEVIKEAEQISRVIDAIAPVARAFSSAPQQSETQHAAAENEYEPSENNGAAATPLFLRPVANIADDGIYNALARAVAE